MIKLKVSSKEDFSQIEFICDDFERLLRLLGEIVDTKKSHNLKFEIEVIVGNKNDE